MSTVGDAYGVAASAWADGPERMYAALAAAMLDRSPSPLAGERVADVGAGTGAASRVLAARGATPYGVDLSLAMLRHGREARPPGVVADALALPFRTGALGGVAYAFCLNHLADPVVALREAGRVVGSGGVVLGAVFAATNDHPAKAQVDAVLTAHGWRRPGWHAELKDRIELLLATAERFAAAARAAGLAGVEAVEVAVDSGIREPADLVAWRLGMAHVAPYLMALPPGERAALVAAAEAAVTPEPLRPSVVLLASYSP